MTFFTEDRIQLVKFLRDKQEDREIYLDDIPRDIQAAIFDNHYTNSLGICLDEMIFAYFGRYATDVMYFLCEFQDGYTVDGKSLANDKEYYDYLRSLP